VCLVIITTTFVAASRAIRSFFLFDATHHGAAEGR
jgi:hypothetical protein